MRAAQGAACIAAARRWRGKRLAMRGIVRLRRTFLTWVGRRRNSRPPTGKMSVVAGTPQLRWPQMKPVQTFPMLSQRECLREGRHSYGDSTTTESCANAVIHDPGRQKTIRPRRIKDPDLSYVTATYKSIDFRSHQMAISTFSSFTLCLSQRMT